MMQKIKTFINELLWWMIIIPSLLIIKTVFIINKVEAGINHTINTVKELIQFIKDCWYSDLKLRSFLIIVGIMIIISVTMWVGIIYIIVKYL